MNILRALSATLFGVICSLAISAFVILQTANTTILDKQQVKQWVEDSGAYKNMLSTVLQADSTVQDQTATGNFAASSISSALDQTFSADDIQKAAEQFIDGTYNWLDGKQESVQYNIDVTDKKDEFQANLAAVLEPQIAALPRCTSLDQFDASSPTCVPPGSDAKQLAQSLATDTANQINIFQQPINPDLVTKAQEQSDAQNATTLQPESDPGLQQTRQAAATIRAWLPWLPVMAVASGAVSIALSRRHLRAARHLSGRLTFNMSLLVAVGIIVAVVGQSLDINQYLTGTNREVVSKIIEPLIHQAAPAIGWKLVLVSGIVGALIAILWVTLAIIDRRRTKAQLLAESYHLAQTAPAPDKVKEPAPKDLPTDVSPKA